MEHGRIGFKPSVISPEEHESLQQKPEDPTNGLQGYTELLEWTKTQWGKALNYTPHFMSIAEEILAVKQKLQENLTLKKMKKLSRILKKPPQGNRKNSFTLSSAIR